VKTLADSLWGTASSTIGQGKIGKGRLIWGRSVAEVTRVNGLLPDLEIHESPATKASPPETLSGIPNPGTFDWIHRRIDGADVYFIANLRNTSAAGRFTFRINEKHPELWDAMTSGIRDARL
jgi:hypothetical protein